MSGVISEPAAPAANNTVWNVNSTATAADVQKIIDNSKVEIQLTSLKMLFTTGIVLTNLKCLTL